MSALVHLSDLHLGRTPATEAAARRLVAEIHPRRQDHVIVTGDVTHRGLDAEWEIFLRVFDPLLRQDRVTVVPGNHDRLGDDAARLMRDDVRVSTEVHGRFHLVCFDSTGPHNRSLFAGHGQVTCADLIALDAAIASAAPGATVALLLHHHPLPLPEERFYERLSTWVGLPFATELSTGRALINLCLGRVDALFHGHRHTPSALTLEHPKRPLSLFNAGASTSLETYRSWTGICARIPRDVELRTIHA